MKDRKNARKTFSRAQQTRSKRQGLSPGALRTASAALQPRPSSADGGSAQPREDLSQTAMPGQKRKMLRAPTSLSLENTRTRAVAFVNSSTRWS